MPKPSSPLEVDLTNGVIPISQVAPALAALIKRSQEQATPIIITQKGYPSGVLLALDLYLPLVERAKLAQGHSASATNPTEDSAAEPAAEA